MGLLSMIRVSISIYTVRPPNPPSLPPSLLTSHNKGNSCGCPRVVIATFFSSRRESHSLVML
jgi:hypothetical protein